MKRIHQFITIFFCALSLSLVAQTPSSTLNFPENKHDFGTIKEMDGKVTYKFKFTNTGKEPVSILYARAGCSCVTTQIPKSPVKVGASDYITVTFDPENRPGRFSKEVVVMTADKTCSRIWVRGEVIAGKHTIKENYPYEFGHGLCTNAKALRFGTILPKQQKTINMRFANDFPVGMHLTFEVESDDPDVSVLIPTGCKLAPKGEGEINITVKVNNIFKGERTINLIPVVNNYCLNPIPVIVSTKSPL